MGNIFHDMYREIGIPVPGEPNTQQPQFGGQTAQPASRAVPLGQHRPQYQTGALTQGGDYNNLAAALASGVPINTQDYFSGVAPTAPPASFPPQQQTPIAQAPPPPPPMATASGGLFGNNNFSSQLSRIRGGGRGRATTPVKNYLAAY